MQVRRYGSIHRSHLAHEIPRIFYSGTQTSLGCLCHHHACESGAASLFDIVGDCVWYLGIGITQDFWNPLLAADPNDSPSRKLRQADTIPQCRFNSLPETSKQDLHAFPTPCSCKRAQCAIGAQTNSRLSLPFGISCPYPSTRARLLVFHVRSRNQSLR